MTADPVQLEIEKGVATVKLNQPEVRNALTHELRTAFRDIIGSLEFNEDVRCVVIAGAGNHFMAGGDIRACLLYTSPSPRDGLLSRMPSSA